MGAQSVYPRGSWYGMFYLWLYEYFMNVLDLGKLALGKKLTFNL